MLLVLAVITWRRSGEPTPFPATTGEGSPPGNATPSVARRLFPSGEPGTAKPPRHSPPPKRIVIRSTAPARSESKDLVDFKVVDGLAITMGDILLGTPEDPQIKVGRYQPPPVQLWDKPEIPYAITPEVAHPERVEAALQYFKAHTPVSFVPYQDQADALVFEPGSKNCLSSLGRVGGLQPIKLSPNCSVQAILHELLHALGFVHEQSRPDRDQFVAIDWDSIDEEYKSQFEIVPDAMMDAERNTPFDYHSVMLYEPTMFAARPGEVVLKSKSEEPIAPAQNGLSPGDIERLVRLYGSGPSAGRE